MKSRYYIPLMALTLLFFTFPICFMALVSLKGQADITTGHVFPSTLFWQNYPDAFDSIALDKYLRNSAIVATCGACLTLLIAVPATHGIVRYGVGEKWLPSVILGSYVAPPIVALFPLFFLLRNMGLVNTHVGLILVYGVMNLPVAFWLLSSFVRRLPVELEEAARVDGISYFRRLRSIVIPLLMPGIASTGIICLILSYNEFLFASFLARSADTQTVPIGLSLFQGDRQLRFGQMAVASLAAMVPVYVLAVFFQRWLVGGLTKGIGK
ncbi:carbohydrate ABC transporter permease [Oricola sp.]|uniref:carbohydrate ABC transporter permease n=1 Tax=Oricola sp. TaxID=1979950 RepID=UPI003BAA0323